MPKSIMNVLYPKNRTFCSFQNYGALLRKGELDRAKEIYNQGLSYFPGEQGIEKIILISF